MDISCNNEVNLYKYSSSKKNNYPGKILLAEDNSSITSLHNIYLNYAGFNVDIVYSGESVLKKLANSYSLIILDADLPLVNGFTLCQLLRKDAAFKSTPIIISVSSSKSELMECCFSVGAQDVIPKTLSPDKIIEIVKYWLSQEKLNIR